MAITPNYRKSTPLRLNLPKNIEAKPTENTGSTQSNNNTETSGNKTGGAIGNQLRLASSTLIQILELEQQIAEDIKKQGQIYTTLEKINEQIAALQNSLGTNSQTDSRLADLLAEKDALETELDTINKELDALQHELSYLKNNKLDMPTDNNSTHILF